MSDFHYPSKIVTASKDYHCMACEWINDAWNEAHINQLAVDELIAYQKAKANNFRIKKGEKYIYQAGVYDRSFYVFRGIPEMNYLCHKYELYPEV